MKPVYVLIIAIIILIPALAYTYSLEDDDDGNGKISYEKALIKMLNAEVETNLTEHFFILDIEPGDEEFEDVMTRAASLTPLFVQSGSENVIYNPVVVGTEEKGVGILSDLTPREVVTLSPEEINSIIYAKFYSLSSAAFLVTDYTQALAVAPTASLAGVPIFLKSDATVKNTMKSLDVEFVIALGNTRVPDDIDYTRLMCSEMNDFFLELLGMKGMSTDYIVVANPYDITDYKDMMNEAKLPVIGLSLLSAELAAYHRAPIYFSKGLPEFDKEYGDGFTQLGVPRVENNEYANITYTRVLEGVSLLSNHNMSAQYLGLVGGPVTLPFYYEDIMAYNQNRQYTPVDHYFANLNDDPYQELAVGRIFARSLTDASLLLVRTLGFDEIKDYDYPRDESSIIYDSVSEDWKENSFMAVGTTKIGPGPGILTPTLANQTRTMAEGGYHVTPLGYDIATQAEIVKEIIDEMNYAVYYGHGNYDCWYSTVPDPIDSDMLNAQDLKPGSAIAMACLTGMTDSATIDLDQMISLAFLHSGFTGYIGATRVAYGLYDYEQREDGILRGTDALYLVDVFSENICKKDMDVGEALRQAKNSLIDTQGWDDHSTKITVYEYVLYGDPTCNLYVPLFDG